MNLQKQEKIQEPKKLNVLSDPYRMIPKVCTGVNFAVVNNNRVIITLTYKEGDSQEVLIERVMVDLEHAKKIREVLEGVLNAIPKEFENIRIKK